MGEGDDTLCLGPKKSRGKLPKAWTLKICRPKARLLRYLTEIMAIYLDWAGVF